MLSRVTRCPLVLLFGLAICLSPPASQVARAAAHSPPAYENFAEWRDACRSLPTYRSLAGRLPPKESLPLPSFGPLSGLLDEFFNLCRTGTLAQAKLWVGGMPAKEQFFNTDRIYFIEPAISFQPCAQKLLLPEGAEIIFHGDLHGDIHSLNGMLDWLNRSNYLSGFTVSRPNTHLIFLGDFTDRGVYSIEVVYTLLRLKLANPERVHLVRGTMRTFTWPRVMVLWRKARPNTAGPSTLASFAGSTISCRWRFMSVAAPTSFNVATAEWSRVIRPPN